MFKFFLLFWVFLFYINAITLKKKYYILVQCWQNSESKTNSKRCDHNENHWLILTRLFYRLINYLLVVLFQNTWFSSSAFQFVLHPSDNDTVISIRCAGKHVKHAGRGGLTTMTGKPWRIVTVIVRVPVRTEIEPF